MTQSSKAGPGTTTRPAARSGAASRASSARTSTGTTAERKASTLVEPAAETTAAAPATKKTATSKTAAPAKTAATAKSAVSKTATSKTAAPKSTTSKTAASKTATSKTATSKTATSKTATSRTATSKTAASKTATSKTATSKTAPAKAAPRKRSAAKKEAAPSGARLPADTGAASSPIPTEAAPTDIDVKALVVREDESPWTAGELAEVRAELEDEEERLRGEISVAAEDLAAMLQDGGDGAGDDQADAGSKTFEREHEMSLANNARDMLVQVSHAMHRINDGTYGACESCGNPIGKARLQAFPRATLCLTCKQREERR